MIWRIPAQACRVPVSANWLYEPEFTHANFCATAKNAKVAGLAGRNVIPYVSLGTAYIHNGSQPGFPDINAQAKETVRFILIS